MGKLSTLLVLLCIGILWVVKCDVWPAPHKKTEEAIKNPYVRGFVQDYVAFVEAEMRRTQMPGAAVVIVKDSSILFLKGFGVKEIHGRDSVDAHTLFRVGSLSKGFAGILTAMLEREGVLRLEDPVVKYLPDFQLRSPEQSRRITLRHLLSHSTGLPYHTYTNLIEAGEDIPRIAARFKEVRLVGREGEVFSYQNAAFSVIEEVIRTASGQAYVEVLQKKIFEKTGMRDASATYSGMMGSRNKAYPHEGFDSAWVRTDITRRYYNSAAAGGVNASISDMGQWLLVLLGNRPDIAPEETLDNAFTPLIKTHNERRFFSAWTGEKEASYGLGWRILKTPVDTILYHGGYVNSYKGEIALHRGARIGVCVLMNGAGSMSERLVPEFFDIYRAYADSIQAWKPKY
ncbi:MAG: serine hydrolase domain-containing protein [Haliscomenobacter sp.]